MVVIWAVSHSFREFLRMQTLLLYEIGYEPSKGEGHSLKLNGGMGIT